jgi:hypothetical protein
MKKTLLFLLLCATAGMVNAQKKHTKADVIGTYKFGILDGDGKIYYDAVKDSVWVSDEVMEQIPGMADADSATKAQGMGMVKMQFAGLKNISITLNADGTFKGATKSGTYTFDEAAQTITVKDAAAKTAEDQTQVFEVLPNGDLKASMNKGGESGSMIFKKSK